MEIGARAPLHITAAGKIFLLEDGPDKCREYAQRTGLDVFTRNTIRGLTALNKALDRVLRSRSHGRSVICLAQEQREGIRSGTRPDQPEIRSTSASIQRLMRLASAILENLPQESSNTMITDLSAIMACITRQRPASLM